MSHEIFIKEIPVGYSIECSCGEFKTSVTDERYIASVKARHILHTGVWPEWEGIPEKYSKGLNTELYNDWPN